MANSGGVTDWKYSSLIGPLLCLKWKKKKTSSSSLRDFSVTIECQCGLYFIFINRDFYWTTFDWIEKFKHFYDFPVRSEKPFHSLNCTNGSGHAHASRAPSLIYSVYLLRSQQVMRVNRYGCVRARVCGERVMRCATQQRRDYHRKQIIRICHLISSMVNLFRLMFNRFHIYGFGECIREKLNLNAAGGIQENGVHGKWKGSRSIRTWPSHHRCFIVHAATRVMSKCSVPEFNCTFVSWQRSRYC